MNLTGQIVSNITVGGVAFSSTTTRTGTGQESHNFTVPAGIAGKISATGIDNLPTGHGLTTGQTIDVHWTHPADGTTHKCRRGFLIDSDATNSITFNETPPAAGDTLPANGTDCVASVVVAVNADFTGSELVMTAFRSTQKSIVDFWTSTASLYVAKMVAGQAYSWASDTGVNNPFTGDPVDVFRVSNGSTVAMTFQLGVLFISAV